MEHKERKKNDEGSQSRQDTEKGVERGEEGRGLIKMLVVDSLKGIPGPCN